MSNQHSELDRRIEELVRCAWGTSARVLRVQALAGDASSRTYLRILLDAAAVRTAVVMIQSGSGLSISSDELAVLEAPPNELPFLNVQRYFGSLGIAVPEVYAADGNLVVLEDLGDLSLWDAARSASPERVLELYRAAIDEMVALQVGGAEQPDPRCIAFQQRFDSRLFLWELEHFLEYGFTGRALAQRDRAELHRIFETLAQELGADPMALTHRDYHSWNLFVQEGKVRVIDFQDALLAPVPYDLATLLNDRSTPKVITAPLELTLVEHFLSTRNRRTGENVALADFLPRYDRFVLQKSLKIVGRFHYLERVKGRRGYVAMLPDTFATLRRCFSRLSELRDLAAILVHSFPEIA